MAAPSQFLSLIVAAAAASEGVRSRRARDNTCGEQPKSRLILHALSHIFVTTLTMARFAVAQRNYKRNESNSARNSLPFSPSKDRKRPVGGKLRISLLILSLVLTACLALSQAIFWTRRTDLEAAVNYALDYTERRVERRLESTVAGVYESESNDVQQPESNDVQERIDNRTMKVYELGELLQSETTVVTGYFQLKSKYSNQKYDKWMTNMLSMRDSMVIFTSSDLVKKIQKLRSHANNTVIISIPLEQTPMALEFSESFWKKQLKMDPERSIHHGYPLFWIWLSKSWFVTEAIERNYFQSSIFMWSDIGCFRFARYRGKKVIQHSEMVPRHSILQMAHHEPNPPGNHTIWNDKYRQKQHFYHSGSQAIGYADTWREFHGEFMDTIHEFISREMFIGEDQTVLQSTCLRNPNLCAYVPYTQVQDNHYFGLRHVLHNGGNYTYWRPPGASVTQEHVTSTE